MELYKSDRQMREKETELAEDEFQDLPPSALKNVKERHMFDDYLASDLIIEVSRGLKYHMLEFLKGNDANYNDVSPEQRESDLEFLRENDLKEWLERDEYVHYGRLLETLDMNQKWSVQETDNYLNQSMNEFHNQLEKAKQVLDNLNERRNIRDSASKRRSKTPEKKISQEFDIL